MNKTFRLQTKLLTVVSIVIVSIAVVSSAIITMVKEKNLTRATFKQMERDSEYLSRRIGQNMYNSNWRTLQITLNINMKNHPDIIYFFIQDFEDTILLANDETIIGTRDPLLVPILDIPPTESSTAYTQGPFTIRNMTLLKDTSYQNELRGVTAEEIFDASRMITHAGEAIGILRIGYSQKKLRHQIRSIRVNTILAGLSILLPVLACILFIVRKHTTPLSLITRELSKLKSHETSRSIPRLLEEIDLDQIKATTTETKELKDAFNEIKKLLIENWNQLENHRNHLEENVEERTGELSWANAKLRQEKQERERVEDEKSRLSQHLLQAQKLESLGTLAGGIAHDMNNLLMAIQGNVSLMLMNTEPDDPSYERGRTLEELVNSGSALTRQLLGFARSGKYNVKPENINAIVRKSLSMFGRTRKEISIHESYHEGVLTVEVDANQIEQVLINILLNASHAMPGGGSLYIRTKPVELDDAFVAPYNASPGDYVRISVKDTGIGMDEKTISKIFDPFFTTREMGRGTGLGLASAYGIIQNHNGIIDVTSEPKSGTTLDIYLALSAKAVKPETETTVIVEKGKETILIIDDEPSIREITMEMLRELGYNCLTAENGRKGTELYKKHHGEIDLVLLDMIMPDEGGDIVYKNLTAIDPQVKVILSSGYSLEGEAEKIISAGCNGFIQKPFPLYELSESIRRVLTGGMAA